MTQSSNKRLEFAPVGRPTRKGDAPLVAAQAFVSDRHRRDCMYPMMAFAALILGGILGVNSRTRSALVVSVVLPWIIFLLFNLYLEKHSRDREVLQGSFWFFQFTEGTIMALAGWLGFAAGGRANNALKGRRAKRARP